MKTLILAAIRCFLILVLPTGAYAISAQWDLDPISGDWNTAANWTPMGIPNGPADIATFGPFQYYRCLDFCEHGSQ